MLLRLTVLEVHVNMVLHIFPARTTERIHTFKKHDYVRACEHACMREVCAELSV